jgi:hypothetical protein
VPTAVEKVRIVETDEVDGEALERGLQRLLGAARRHDRPALLECIRSLVPECVPPLRFVEATAPGTVPVSRLAAAAEERLEAVTISER